VRHALAPKVAEVVDMVEEVVGMVEEVEVVGMVEEVEVVGLVVEVVGADTKIPVSYELRP
jgi:hypothetical protein